MKKKYLYGLLLLFLLITATSLFFILKTQKTNQSTIPIPDTALKISENLYILPTSNNNNQKGTIDSTNNLYLVNEKTKKKLLIQSSDIPIKLSKITGEQKVYKQNDNTYFATYEFTEIKKEKRTYQRPEKGYVYKVDRNGSLSKIYTTHNIFDSIDVVDNQLVMYEKIYTDDMNIYPSYYKPYIRVKKILSGSKFQEIERKVLEPRK
jgi:hypothetical protein